MLHTPEAREFAKKNNITLIDENDFWITFLILLQGIVLCYGEVAVGYFKVFVWMEERKMKKCKEKEDSSIEMKFC